MVTSLDLCGAGLCANTFVISDDLLNYAAWWRKIVVLHIKRRVLKVQTRNLHCTPLKITAVESNAKSSIRVGCSWSWPACGLVQREPCPCVWEVCGSRRPEEEGSAVCSRARRRPDPAESPPTHLHGEERELFVSETIQTMFCTLTLSTFVNYNKTKFIDNHGISWI